MGWVEISGDSVEELAGIFGLPGQVLTGSPLIGYSEPIPTTNWIWANNFLAFGAPV